MRVESPAVKKVRTARDCGFISLIANGFLLIISHRFAHHVAVFACTFDAFLDLFSRKIPENRIHFLFAGVYCSQLMSFVFARWQRHCGDGLRSLIASAWYSFINKSVFNYN